MDTETVWIGIIIPIVIGPLAVFFKSLYDNYKNNKNETAKIKYNEKLDTLKNQLNDFYYPLYIKLICLYNYDYNIPISRESLDKMCQNDNHDCSSQEQTNESSDNEETNICRGYYMQENRSYHKCNNIIPINSIEDICKECRWKNCNGTIKLQIEEKGKVKNKDAITLDFRGSNLDDELDESKMERELKKMEFLKYQENGECDRETVKEMKQNITTLYTEIKTLLSQKMLLANPNVYMKEHFIQLLKYIDLYLISTHTHCELSIYEKYGIRNNTVKVLKIVEKKVYKLNNKHHQLIKNGPFNYH
jgi:hypothetical protein